MEKIPAPGLLQAEQAELEIDQGKELRVAETTWTKKSVQTPYSKKRSNTLGCIEKLKL
ncbi:MAG: hypothetical protein HY892_08480 [Deltaproteobacteria bacterium]|nr:hypothetical protein [Deltaproteobacteria bacterium]